MRVAHNQHVALVADLPLVEDGVEGFGRTPIADQNFAGLGALVALGTADLLEALGVRHDAVVDLFDVFDR